MVSSRSRSGSSSKYASSGFAPSVSSVLLKKLRAVLARPHQGFLHQKDRVPAIRLCHSHLCDTLGQRPFAQKAFIATSSEESPALRKSLTIAAN